MKVKKALPYIGRRVIDDIVHPLTGEVIIAEGENVSGWFAKQLEPLLIKGLLSHMDIHQKLAPYGGVTLLY